MSHLHLGEKLRAFRIRRGLKQEALAVDLGVSQASISRIESGSFEPSAELARSIESLLARPENQAPASFWVSAVKNLAGYFALYRWDGRRFADPVRSQALSDWLVSGCSDAGKLTETLEATLGAQNETLRRAGASYRSDTMTVGASSASFICLPLVDETGVHFALVQMLVHRLTGAAQPACLQEAARV